MQILKNIFLSARSILILLCLVFLFIACQKPLNLRIYDSLQSEYLENFPTDNYAVLSDTIPNPIPPGPFTYMYFDTIPNPIPPSLQSSDVTSFVATEKPFEVMGKTVEVMKAQNTNPGIPLFFINEIKSGEKYYILRVTQKQADVRTTSK